MRVLVDALAVTRNKAGVGVYACNLLRELVQQFDGDQLYILAQDDDPDLDFSAHAGVTMIWVSARYFRKLPLRFLYEQLGIPWLARRYRIDVVHSLHYSLPILPMKSRRVVTFHDMTFFDMPEMHLRSKVIYFRAFIRASVRLADAIIFVSQSAKKDCLSRFHKLHGLDAVIHHGCSERFLLPPRSEQVEAARHQYGLPASFILYIGTLEPRKNLSRLIQAFASIAISHPETQLVLAGARGWMCDQLAQEVASLGLNGRVLFLGFIPETDKRLVIAAATVFAYPSLYEGFGLPVLEALACGIPTVTSNVSAIPEITADAALLIDPTDTQELAISLHHLLNEPDIRQQLQNASRKQAAQFSWQTAARKTHQVYRNVVMGAAGGEAGPSETLPK